MNYTYSIINNSQVLFFYLWIKCRIYWTKVKAPEIWEGTPPNLLSDVLLVNLGSFGGFFVLRQKELKNWASVRDVSAGKGACAKPEDLRSNSRPHVVEGEKRLPQSCPLTCTHTRWSPSNCLVYYFVLRKDGETSFFQMLHVPHPSFQVIRTFTFSSD